MRLMLPDFIEETTERFHRYMARAKGCVKRGEYSKAAKWYRLALGSAMDHGQDFLCRKLMDQLDQRSVKRAGTKSSTR
jgi:hypothetical protein